MLVLVMVNLVVLLLLLLLLVGCCYIWLQWWGAGARSYCAYVDVSVQRTVTRVTK